MDSDFHLLNRFHEPQALGSPTRGLNWELSIDPTATEAVVFNDERSGPHLAFGGNLQMTSYCRQILSELQNNPQTIDSEEPEDLEITQAGLFRFYDNLNQTQKDERRSRLNTDTSLRLRKPMNPDMRESMLR